MHTTLIVIDSSPQLLPGVGGRDQPATRIDADSAHKIAAALDAAGHPLDIYVIAERALPPTEARKLPGTVPVDLAAYVSAGFDGIYGALGLPAPTHLSGAKPALDPESLGHAAIRYVLGQSVHPDGTRECAPGRGTVHLFEVGGALGVMVRAALVERASQSAIICIATNAPNGIPAGMSPWRAEVETEIHKLIDRLTPHAAEVITPANVTG